MKCWFDTWIELDFGERIINIFSPGNEMINS